MTRRLLAAASLAWCTACARNTPSSSSSVASVARAVGETLVPVRAQCKVKRASGNPRNDQNPEELLRSCLGHPIMSSLPAIDIGQTSKVVDATYAAPSGTVDVLAWLESDAEEVSVVALTATPLNGSRTVSLRLEHLAQENAVVQSVAWNCAGIPGAPLSPRVAARSTAGSERPRPSPRPDECASRVERVWMRRDRTFQLVGAYPVEGKQRIDGEFALVRHFSSAPRFDGDSIHVHDQATWYWLTGKSRPIKLNGNFELEVKNEASSEAERTFRFDHDTLVEVTTGSGPVPTPEPPKVGWFTTDFGVGTVCRDAVPSEHRP